MKLAIFNIFFFGTAFVFIYIAISWQQVKPDGNLAQLAGLNVDQLIAVNVPDNERPCNFSKLEKTWPECQRDLMGQCEFTADNGDTKRQGALKDQIGKFLKLPVKKEIPKGLSEFSNQNRGFNASLTFAIEGQRQIEVALPWHAKLCDKDKGDRSCPDWVVVQVLGQESLQTYFATWNQWRSHRPRYFKGPNHHCNW